MSTEALALYKMSGAGNDFLFVNLFDSKTRNQTKKLEKKLSRAELAKKLCRRHQSIGADGLIFIEKSKDLDFQWDFYNSDGSHAEMCGNASRCAVRFAKEILRLKKTTVQFKTASGEVKGKLLGALRASVQLSAPKLHHEGLSVDLRGKKWLGTYLNAGVPQFVTEFKFRSPSEIDKAAALGIQTHKIFGPQQTNVTFIEILKKNRVRAVTFERGVKDFTLACGTGAIAAAFALVEKTKAQDTIFVEMPGGVLSVIFDNGGLACLEGDALLLGKVEAFLESLYGDGKI
jgi:diaminopimelate epimerase